MVHDRRDTMKPCGVIFTTIKKRDETVMTTTRLSACSSRKGTTTRLNAREKNLEDLHRHGHHERRELECQLSARRTARSRTQPLSTHHPVSAGRRKSSTLCHSRCLARLAHGLRTDLRSTSFGGHWQRDPGARVLVFRRRRVRCIRRETEHWRVKHRGHGCKRLHHWCWRLEHCGRGCDMLHHWLWLARVRCTPPLALTLLGASLNDQSKLECTSRFVRWQS